MRARLGLACGARRGLAFGARRGLAFGARRGFAFIDFDGSRSIHNPTFAGNGMLGAINVLEEFLAAD